MRVGSWKRRHVVALSLAAITACVAAPISAETLKTEFRSVHQLLSSWQIGEAAEALAALGERHATAPEWRVAYARLLHMQRDFPRAAHVLEGLCGESAAPADRALCDVVTGSHEATLDFKSATTSGGHFVLHYLPGPDEVLVPYADETLEAAYRELGALFRYFPDEPVHVDILPRVDGLAQMTPLSHEEIKTSGVIAMCKFDRLMIVSPRDLVYGYGWRDTLSHEYIHYLLTRRSHNRVPLWLHEGLAKYFERRWRGLSEPSLPPTSEHMLAEAVQEGKLIPLEKLHPSIGKLPSQDDAALAFAQVFTLVDWMFTKGGAPGISRLIDHLTAGETLDAALKDVYQVSFVKLQQTWKRWLKRKRLRRIPHAYRPRLLFRGSDRSEDELMSIEEEQGRDLTYLGDLLRARGRHDAALVEYRKAVKVVGGSSPVLQSKMAASELALGRFRDVLASVETVLQSYPGYVLLHLHQGEALLRLGHAAEAAAALVTANGLNPFDPRLHELLAEAYEAMGERDSAVFERRQHALVAQE